MDSEKCKKSNFVLMKSTGNPKQYQRKSIIGSIQESHPSKAKNYEKAISCIELQPNIKITHKSKTLPINEIIQRDPKILNAEIKLEKIYLMNHKFCQELIGIETDCEPVENSVEKVFTIENEDFSMSVLPKQMADQSNNKNESLGRGGKVVNFLYSSSHFGPIYVKHDNEVKDVLEIAKSNINELKYKDLNGGRSCKGFYHSAAATRARTNLREVIIRQALYV